MRNYTKVVSIVFLAAVLVLSFSTAFAADENANVIKNMTNVSKNMTNATVKTADPSAHVMSTSPACTFMDVTLTPSNRAYYLNGCGRDLNHNHGKYEEAIKLYDEAIKLVPNYAEAYYNKGLALKALGRTEEANAAFAKANDLGYMPG